MRGTRVDRLKNNRYRVIQFGRFETSTPSEELDLSEKDFTNLYYQMQKIIKDNKFQRREDTD